MKRPIAAVLVFDSAIARRRTLLSVLIAIGVVATLTAATWASDGAWTECTDCCGCRLSRNANDLPASTSSGFTVSTASLVSKLAERLEKAGRPLLGLAIPALTVDFRGPSTGSVGVSCQASVQGVPCCAEPTPLLAVLPVLHMTGEVRNRDAYLWLPSRSVTAAAYGPVIIDAVGRDISSLDRDPDPWEVSGSFTIAGGSTTVSLAWLGDLSIDVWGSRSKDDIQAVVDAAERKGGVTDVGIGRGVVTPYCVCIAHADADAVDLLQSANAAPVAEVPATIAVGLRGIAVEKVSVADYEGDPIYIHCQPLRILPGRGTLEWSLDESRHALIVTAHDLDALQVADLCARVLTGNIYIYDLHSGVSVSAGAEPREGEYYHRQVYEVTLRFLDIEPPQAVNVHETKTQGGTRTKASTSWLCPIARRQRTGRSP